MRKINNIYVYVTHTTPITHTPSLCTFIYIYTYRKDMYISAYQFHKATFWDLFGTFILAKTNFL